MPTVYNAANEKAVELFLKGELSYLGIAQLIEEAMERHKVIANPTVAEILDTEQEIYEYCKYYSETQYGLGRIDG